MLDVPKIMPPIGAALGGVDFKDLFYNLDSSKLTKAGAAVIAYEPVVQLLEDACESLPSAVGPAAVG